jgi:hypothetical protein
MLQYAREGRSAAEIAQALHEATGEQIAPETLAYRLGSWIGYREAREMAAETAQGFMDELAAGDLSSSEFVLALLTDSLMDTAYCFGQGDSYDLRQRGLAAQRIHQTREQSVLLSRRRQARSRPARPSLTDEEKYHKIREIYGLPYQPYEPGDSDDSNESDKPDSGA